MGTNKTTLSLGKRLSCGLALSGTLLSACVFGLATAETTETKVAKPVRILLTDDTPDSTLSIRRKAADQRNTAKLYNNDLRPKKVVEAEIKPAPAEIVTPKVIAPKVIAPKVVTPKAEVVEPVEEISQAKPEKNGLDSILTTLTFPKFDIIADIDSAFNAIGDELSIAAKSPSDISPTNNHNSKFRQTQSNREPRPSAGSVDQANADLPPSNQKSEFRQTQSNRGHRPSAGSTAAPVHMLTIGSLDGIQFPKVMLADINSILGIDTVPAVDEDVEIPAAALDKSQEQIKESAKDSVKEKQSAVGKEPRSIIALLGLEGLWIPEFNNPFAVGTGIKETKENVEPVDTKDTKPSLDDSGLDPDETITSELPSLRTDHPDVPGVKQVPPLAPEKIPNAPNAINEEDKSANRNLPYQTLVNPDSFLPRRSAVPVSVRISDTLNR